MDMLSHKVQDMTHKPKWVLYVSYMISQCIPACMQVCPYLLACKSAHSLLIADMLSVKLTYAMVRC